MNRWTEAGGLPSLLVFHCVTFIVVLLLKVVAYRVVDSRNSGKYYPLSTCAAQLHIFNAPALGTTVIQAMVEADLPPLPEGWTAECALSLSPFDFARLPRDTREQIQAYIDAMAA
jgi:hypothetical protein